MSDLTQQLIERIRANKLPELQLEDDCIHPAYDGLSILNLPGSLAKWFDAPALPHPPIDIP